MSTGFIDVTDKYSYCPNCGRKSVYFKMKPNGEDNYSCRFSICGFYFFTNSNSPIDFHAEERWKTMQELTKVPGVHASNLVPLQGDFEE